MWISVIVHVLLFHDCFSQLADIQMVLYLHTQHECEFHKHNCSFLLVTCNKKHGQSWNQ